MKNVICRTLARTFPQIQNIGKQIRNFRVLAIDLGQWRSMKQRIPVDAAGTPVPWYTYPAIEYLSRLDMSDKSVFEWGAGNSSLFWARRAREVVSIEHNRSWFEIVEKRRLDNQKIFLLERKDDYIQAVLRQSKRFDVIVIDGEYRYSCSQNAVRCLAESCLVILDNSDWYPRTAKTLREYGLNQIDFSGFGPVNGYTWTTSLFLSDKFSGAFLFNQPLQPIGGLKQRGDE